MKMKRKKIPPPPDSSNEDNIQYKETSKWKTEHQNVKSILKNREPIEKKKAKRTTSMLPKRSHGVCARR